MPYQEEDYLQLSGIQHFLFCRRQWALIHLEQQWAENSRTAEGQLMHQRAHDPEHRARRGRILTVGELKIHSARLGLAGACDLGRRGAGNPIRWSINGDPPSRISPTWPSSARRLCVWKRCFVQMCRRGLSITGRPGTGRRFRLPRSCGSWCGIPPGRCTNCIGGDIPRR